MKEQCAREEWGQDVPTTDRDYKSHPRLRRKFPGMCGKSKSKGLGISERG